MQSKREEVLIKENETIPQSATLTALFAQGPLNGLHLNLMCRNDDADIIVVFGGTNDYGHGDAPLGEFADRDSDTFYGACHELYCKLINKYPDKVIVVVTPLHRENETCLRGEGNKEKDVAPLSKYVDIIKEVARYYSLPVCDLYEMSGIQPNIPIIKEMYMPDGVHPNDKGHELVAERLGQFLKCL